MGKETPKSEATFDALAESMGEIIIADDRYIELSSQFIRNQYARGLCSVSDYKQLFVAFLETHNRRQTFKQTASSLAHQGLLGAAIKKSTTETENGS